MLLLDMNLTKVAETGSSVKRQCAGSRTAAAPASGAPQPGPGPGTQTGGDDQNSNGTQNSSGETVLYSRRPQMIPWPNAGQLGRGGQNSSSTQGSTNGTKSKNPQLTQRPCRGGRRSAFDKTGLGANTTSSSESNSSTQSGSSTQNSCSSGQSSSSSRSGSNGAKSRTQWHLLRLQHELSNSLLAPQGSGSKSGKAALSAGRNEAARGRRGKGEEPAQADENQANQSGAPRAPDRRFGETQSGQTGGAQAGQMKKKGGGGLWGDLTSDLASLGSSLVNAGTSAVTGLAGDATQLAKGAENLLGSTATTVDKTAAGAATSTENDLRSLDRSFHNFEKTVDSGASKLGSDASVERDTVVAPCMEEGVADGGWAAGQAVGLSRLPDWRGRAVYGRVSVALWVVVAICALWLESFAVLDELERGL